MQYHTQLMRKSGAVFFIFFKGNTFYESHTVMNVSTYTIYLNFHSFPILNENKKHNSILTEVPLMNTFNNNVELAAKLYEVI